MVFRLCTFLLLLSLLSTVHKLMYIGLFVKMSNISVYAFGVAKNVSVLQLTVLVFQNLD